MDYLFVTIFLSSIFLLIFGSVVVFPFNKKKYYKKHITFEYYENNIFNKLNGVVTRVYLDEWCGTRKCKLTTFFEIFLPNTKKYIYVEKFLLRNIKILS